MRKVIDLECDLPPDEHGKLRKNQLMNHPPGYGDPERLPPLPGHGFDNYTTIFTGRASPGLERGSLGLTMTDFVSELDRAGIEVGVIRGPNDMLADIVAEFRRPPACRSCCPV